MKSKKAYAPCIYFFTPFILSYTMRCFFEILFTNRGKNSKMEAIKKENHY